MIMTEELSLAAMVSHGPVKKFQFLKFKQDRYDVYGLAEVKNNEMNLSVVARYSLVEANFCEDVDW